MKAFIRLTIISIVCSILIFTTIVLVVTGNLKIIYGFIFLLLNLFCLFFFFFKAIFQRKHFFKLGQNKGVLLIKMICFLLLCLYLFFLILFLLFELQSYLNNEVGCDFCP